MNDRISGKIKAPEANRCFRDFFIVSDSDRTHAFRKVQSSPAWRMPVYLRISSLVVMRSFSERS